VSKSIFRKIDSRVWNMLWKWAKRRHPHKSKKWITSKYWQTIGKRKWVFASGNIQLKYLSNTRIIRTIPIKLDKIKIPIWIETIGLNTKPKKEIAN